MKNSINHILVPTDFSGFSNRAFSFACKIAQRSKAKLLLFHVVEPPYNFATAVKGMIEMMEKNAQNRMDQLIQESGSSLKISTDIRHGRTAREIIKSVEREGIDLVVMGSRGQSALSRAVLGSVTEVVAHELSVPLFLIPFQENAEEIDPEGSTVIFATDFKPGDIESFRYSRYFAKLFDADVAPAHYSPAPGFEERIRHAGFTQLLREQLDDDSIDIEGLSGDNLQKSISDYADVQDAFAVVFNRYNKNALQHIIQKDHTEEMVLHSKTPLLIIPTAS